ncbi:MAG: hypothetical protein ACK5P5_02645 [Pseudobdellovibrionaceae bacterium]|jgi:hypothetical protein
MFSKLILCFTLFSVNSFATDKELSSLREQIQQIEQKHPKFNPEMKKEIQLLKKNINALLKSKEKDKPTPEEFDAEVEVRTLFLTWEPIFEMNKKKNKKKCADYISELEFEGMIGMEEDQLRPDYDIAIKLLNKICFNVKK